MKFSYFIEILCLPNRDFTNVVSHIHTFPYYDSSKRLFRTIFAVSSRLIKEVIAVKKIDFFCPRRCECF